MVFALGGKQFVRVFWLIMIAATMAAAAAIPGARAYQNEPDGFRGFAWGTPKDQVDAKVDFTFNRMADPNLAEYRSRHDLSMNGIELTYNLYEFYKGRFMAGIDDGLCQPLRQHAANLGRALRRADDEGQISEVIFLGGSGHDDRL